jgi:hypothetical protein
MKTFEDVFSVLLHNYSSKKRKQLVSPLLSLDYRRTATVGSYWRGMGEASF